MNTTVVRQPRRIRGVSFKRPAHRAPGQSMVLIALMLLVLIAFAGLSVDVGNAYAQQRRVQQASGAASLAGMAAVQNQKTNGGILDDIKRSMAANGIDFTGVSAYSYSANYVISGDNTPHPIASYTQSATPSNVERVQVTISNAVRTVFARVVGRPDLTVSATSHACLDGYNTAAVFPIGIPLQLDATNHTKYLAWDVATHTGSSLIPTTTPGWSAWHTYQNSPFHQSEYVKLPFGSGNGIPGVHMMWLEWGGQNGASTLNASIWFPGNLGKRPFVEASPPKGTNSTNGPHPGKLEPGDWVSIQTGTVASTQPALTDHVTRHDVLLLPMYSEAGGTGNGRAMRIAKMGRFYMIDADTTSSNKFLTLEYLGDSGGAVVLCGAPKNEVSGAGSSGRVVSGQVRYDLLDATLTSGTPTSDVVMVESVASNMNLDMNGGTAGSLRKNLVQSAFTTFINNFHTVDPNASAAMITYGNSSAGSAPYTTSTSGWKRGTTLTDFNSSSSSIQQSIINATGTVRTGNQRPGWSGLDAAYSLHSSPTRSSGQNKVVILLVDGVMNVCGYTSSACNATYPTAQFSGGTDGWATANMQLNGGWPLWQTQEKADQMHAAGVQIYVVALSGPAGTAGVFDTGGLRDISSGPGFYYQVTSALELNSAFTAILSSIQAGPSATGHSLQVNCNPNSSIQAMQGVRVTLYNLDGTVAKGPVWTAADGSFSMTDVDPGDYLVGVKAADSEGAPNLYGNIYDRVFNYDNRGQVGAAGSGAVPITVDTSLPQNVTRTLLLRGTEDNHGFALHTDAGQSGCSPYTP